MSEPKFTKGPWHVCGLKVCDVGYFTIAKCGWIGQSDEEAEANARLISVAPRMYEELKTSASFLKEAEKWFKKRCGDIAIVEALDYTAEKMNKLVKEVEGEDNDE